MNKWLRNEKKSKQRAAVYRTFFYRITQACLKPMSLHAGKKCSIFCGLLWVFCMSAVITVCNQYKTMTSNLTHAACQTIFSSDIILDLQKCLNLHNSFILFQSVTWLRVQRAGYIFCYKALGQIVVDKQMEIQVEACLYWKVTIKLS